MKKENKLRINIAFDPLVLKKIDEYCEKTTLSRSAAVSTLCIEMMEQKEFMKNIPQMLQLIQQTQDKPTE